MKEVEQSSDPLGPWLERDLPERGAAAGSFARAVWAATEHQGSSLVGQVASVRRPSRTGGPRVGHMDLSDWTKVRDIHSLEGPHVYLSG